MKKPKPKKKCAIEGCINPARGRGYCSRHYTRLIRHGSPTAGRTSIGDPTKFFEKALSYDGETCLNWPFGTGSNGYASMYVNGQITSATRMMCEKTHGPPPTPEHHAAHSCGKGHTGCIAKRHLRWATPAENHHDRIAHGTDNRGEKQWKAKLTRSQVIEIRERSKSMTQMAISRQFGVTFQTINDIVRRKTWAWL